MWIRKDVIIKFICEIFNQVKYCPTYAPQYFGAENNLIFNFYYLSCLS